MVEMDGHNPPKNQQIHNLLVQSGMAASWVPNLPGELGEASPSSQLKATIPLLHIPHSGTYFGAELWKNLLAQSEMLERFEFCYRAQAACAAAHGGNVKSLIPNSNLRG